MLRFDKAITFSPILKSYLLVSFKFKKWDLDVLLFSEFINIMFIFIITLLNRFDYVVVYFFSDLFWLIQRINNLPDFI